MSPEAEKQLHQYIKRYQANEYDQESVDGIVSIFAQNSNNEELVQQIIELIGMDKVKMLLALNAPRLLRIPALQN